MDVFLYKYYRIAFLQLVEDSEARYMRSMCSREKKNTHLKHDPRTECTRAGYEGYVIRRLANFENNAEAAVDEAREEEIIEEKC